MRTTLTIDDDLAPAIERYRESQHLSLKKTVNQLLRQGLQAAEQGASSAPYSGMVFDSELLPGIDPARMNQLADDLEVEAFVE